MTQIKTILQDRNLWWKGTFDMPFKERELYHQIQAFLPLPQIIALTGLRRVGKTTILLKLIHDAIRKGVPPQNIVYFSFDETQSSLRDIITVYEQLMEKDIAKERFLLVFDEVQKVPDWESQLKTLYDGFGSRIKILISGSESLFIRKKSKETLAGRIFEFKVNQLTFREFLDFKGQAYRPIGVYEQELKRLFKEFLLTQGFPELVGVSDKEILYKYLEENIVEKVVYRDLPQLFPIREPSVIQSLLAMLRDNPGQLVEISSVARDLGLSRQSVALYLFYLEQAFLVRKLYNFSRNKRKSERKLKKYYPTILHVSLLFQHDDHSQSKIFESVLANQLQAEFFWRDSYQREVDIVLVKDETTPIEIKFGKISYDGLLYFMNSFDCNTGIVLSMQEEKRMEIDGKTIEVIPAWKFLLQKDEHGMKQLKNIKKYKALR